MKVNKADRVFISYAWTGEDEITVRQRIEAATKVFQSAGITAYSNLGDKRIKSFQEPGEFIRHALTELKDCQIVLAIVSSERRSQGQLMEIGAAISQGIPVIVAMHDSARNTGYLEDLSVADEVVYWHDELDLIAQLKSLLQS